MKKTKYITMAVLLLGLTAGCSKSDYKLFDSSDTGIYYTVDKLTYSFGITSMSVTHRVVEVPVRIMGAPTGSARTFTVEIIPDKTNATRGTHFTLPEQFTILPDSVNGVVPIDVMREALGEQEWTLGLRLVADDNFSPVATENTEVVVGFNNIVTPPNWTSYNWMTGTFVPYWPDFQLGPWAPLKYVLFMDYFHKMEEAAPSTYRNLVDLYGPDLENITQGWPWDYNKSLIKYILLPMYEYLEAHPELGVTIPNPL